MPFTFSRGLHLPSRRAGFEVAVYKFHPVMRFHPEFAYRWHHAFDVEIMGRRHFDYHTLTFGLAWN